MQYGYILPSQGHSTPHPGVDKRGVLTRESICKGLGLLSLAAVNSPVLRELAVVSLDSFLKSQERSVGVEI